MIDRPDKNDSGDRPRCLFFAVAVLLVVTISCLALSLAGLIIWRSSLVHSSRQGAIRQFNVAESDWTGGKGHIGWRNRFVKGTLDVSAVAPDSGVSESQMIVSTTDSLVSIADVTDSEDDPRAHHWQPAVRRTPPLNFGTFVYPDSSEVLVTFLARAKIEDNMTTVALNLSLPVFLVTRYLHKPSCDGFASSSSPSLATHKRCKSAKTVCEEDESGTFVEGNSSFNCEWHFSLDSICLDWNESESLIVATQVDGSRVFPLGRQESWTLNFVGCYEFDRKLYRGKESIPRSLSSGSWTRTPLRVKSISIGVNLRSRHDPALVLGHLTHGTFEFPKDPLEEAGFTMLGVGVFLSIMIGFLSAVVCIVVCFGSCGCRGSKASGGDRDPSDEEDPNETEILLPHERRYEKKRWVEDTEARREDYERIGGDQTREDLDERRPKEQKQRTEESQRPREPKKRLSLNSRDVDYVPRDETGANAMQFDFLMPITEDCDEE